MRRFAVLSARHEEPSTPVATASPSRRKTPERWLWLPIVALLVLAIALPGIPQDPGYHRFADARTFLGIPHALDVASNALFAAFAVWGFAWQASGRLAYPSEAMRRAGAVFLLGFLLTAFGSAYYHLAPDDGRLAWDRLGMVIAFAGVIGIAAAQRVSARMAERLVPLALLGGGASVAWFATTGSITPYAVVQFGGLALVVAMTWLPARTAGPNWAAMIASYALAKSFELEDAQVFAFTGGLVSGHTLKHVFAAFAVPALIVPLARARPKEAPGTH